MITKETLANFDLFKGIPANVLDEVAKICVDVFVTLGGYVFLDG